MTQIRYHRMIGGLPVLAVPAEIDLSTVGHFRADLLHLFNLGHRVVVVDMSRTRFCDSAGLRSLVEVHQRVQPDGGEVRLIIPENSAVPRVLILTGTDDTIPCFTSLKEALAGTADSA